MGDSTRPSYQRRQLQKRNTRALAAFSFAALLATAPAALPAVSGTEQPALPQIDSTASTAPAGAPELLVSPVAPGDEELLLTARLTVDSVNPAKDVAWKVRAKGGSLLIDTVAGATARKLPAGDYEVEATYGAVTLRETVSVLAGNAVSVNFVLNAGALRVLPTLKGIAAPNLPSMARIYALSGPQKGKLVAKSVVAAEMLKLPAGLYRVESRIGDGNARAITDVRIRPGRMSAVEVAHAAGLARLSFVGAPTADVQWTVKSKAGAPVGSFDGLMHNVALTPGAYTAEARVNGEVLTASFTIAEGEERDILLGN